MTIKTKLFGKKVKGKSLYQLVKALGEDWDRLNMKNEKYSITSLYGKYKLTPSENGINVDLYIFRTDCHEVDGTSPEDYVSRRIGEDPLINQKEKKFRTIKHFKGEIKYENVSQTRINQ